VRRSGESSAAAPGSLAFCLASRSRACGPVVTATALGRAGGRSPGETILVMAVVPVIPGACSLPRAFFLAAPDLAALKPALLLLHMPLATSGRPALRATARTPSGAPQSRFALPPRLPARIEQRCYVPVRLCRCPPGAAYSFDRRPGPARDANTNSFPPSAAPKL
jgi:hypothetical protein